MKRRIAALALSLLLAGCAGERKNAAPSIAESAAEPSRSSSSAEDDGISAGAHVWLDTLDPDEYAGWYLDPDDGAVHVVPLDKHKLQKRAREQPGFDRFGILFDAPKRYSVTEMEAARKRLENARDPSITAVEIAVPGNFLLLRAPEWPMEAQARALELAEPMHRVGFFIDQPDCDFSREYTRKEISAAQEKLSPVWHELKITSASGHYPKQSGLDVGSIEWTEEKMARVRELLAPTRVWFAIEEYAVPD